ncbi:metallophosphoesterase [Hornefia butyriciproducens]|uniref:metallophosphoesterase n=1 Tax=Hornefia butyriciproducens TaxID=2652293 RepID=UPI002A9170B7|nr:metallophosphoesterase [Hornefia butyriciproducens]MCI7414048.1 metallophosphoesterase [Clostridiales bacterium]MDY6212690.1 metallophosphoesterase [Hornefia butyriciproducens]
MSIYAIGDLHLSFDERIQKPMDIFGDLWADHSARVSENWRGTVRDGDTVLIPGDVSWGLRLDEALADFRWIHELPGRKVITKGNHDLWWTSINKMNQMFDDILFLQNHCYAVPGTETVICGTRGWICPGTEGFDEHDRKIYDRELIRLEFSLEEAKSMGARDIIAALHYPPTNDKLQPSDFTEMLSRYGVNTCVYGHLHGKVNFRRGLQGTMNGVEYRLVSLDYLESMPEKIR